MQEIELWLTDEELRLVQRAEALMRDLTGIQARSRMVRQQVAVVVRTALPAMRVQLFRRIK